MYSAEGKIYALFSERADEMIKVSHCQDYDGVFVIII